MKTKWILKLAMMLSLGFGLSACNSSESSNGKGDEGLGGGDIQVQQVQLLVDDILAKVSAMPEVFPEVDLQQLQATTQKVEIVGKTKTFANGVETDAANNGSTRIELNMTRWNNQKNQNKKSALIFHELLGIMGLEKNNYAISSRLLIEHRFGPERTYTCKQGNATQAGTCQIVMLYDHAQSAFQVEDQNCGNFPSPVITSYRPYGSYFSSTSYCPDARQSDPPESVVVKVPSEGSGAADEPILSAPCQTASSTGRDWDSLYFKNGYNFRFLGVQGSQLNCQLL